MFKVILIPTDGSELSERAIKQGDDLARALGATVVGLSVTMPFHVFAVDPTMVTDTAEKYEHDVRAIAKKSLAVIEAAAKQAVIICFSLCRF